MIVEILGTWCPTCQDQAPVMVELYRQYRAQGLQILGVAYEYADTRELKERRIRDYKGEHGIDWEVIAAEETLDAVGTDGIAGLEGIEGIPVTIFIKRDGTVHAIYAGFSSPAAKAAHRKTKAEFHRLAAEIVGGK